MDKAFEGAWTTLIDFVRAEVKSLQAVPSIDSLDIPAQVVAGKGAIAGESFRLGEAARKEQRSILEALDKGAKATDQISKILKPLGSALGADATRGIVSTTAKEATKASTKGVARATTKVAAEGGKRSAKEAAKGAGRWIGPAVFVAVTTWELYQAYQETQERNRLIEKLAAERITQAEIAVSNAKQRFSGQASSWAIEAFSGIIKRLRDQLSESSRKMDHARNLSAKVAELLVDTEHALGMLNACTRT